MDEENSTIIANGVPVRFIYSSDPTTVDYTEYGIKDALLVDTTGNSLEESFDVLLNTIKERLDA